MQVVAHVSEGVGGCVQASTAWMTPSLWCLSIMTLICNTLGVWHKRVTVCMLLLTHRLVVILSEEIHVFSFPHASKLLKTIETSPNPKGYCVCLIAYMYMCACMYVFHTCTVYKLFLVFFFPIDFVEMRQYTFTVNSQLQPAGSNWDRIGSFSAKIHVRDVRNINVSLKRGKIAQ